MVQRPGQMSTKETWVELSELDRFNSLPDELLLHIMCFLMARQAVQTCILSKRWKNLWRYLPCLNFDTQEFKYAKSFIRFITSFPNFRSISHIVTFRLDSYQFDGCWGWANMIDDCLEAARSLITRVIESRLRVLSIAYSSCNGIDFHYVYTCAFVEEMNLHCILVPHEKPIALVNLKRLNLSGANLDGKSVKNLISGCPVLEDLVLEKCFFQFPNVTIISHTLKNLSIHGFESRNEVEIHLSVPSLVSLHLTRVRLGCISLKNMSSLVHAHIDFCFEVCANYQNSTNELLKGLSHAAYIELTGSRILKSDLWLIKESPVKDLLVKELPNCPAFANLKSLYLTGLNVCNFISPISHFVHISPNLETLTFGNEEMMISGTDAFTASATGNAVFLVGSMPVTIQFAQADSNANV